MASSNGLIWIQGKPGAGKSTTMRFAVQKFKENCSAGNELVISFFIHGRGTTLQKTPLGLFRGLLHSLLQENPKLLPRLARRFVHRNDNMGEYGSKWYWVENELGDYLAEFISETSKSRPVVVFVDALDELGRSSAIAIVTFIMARQKPVVSGSVSPAATIPLLAFSTEQRFTLKTKTLKISAPWLKNA